MKSGKHRWRTETIDKSYYNVFVPAKNENK